MICPKCDSEKVKVRREEVGVASGMRRVRKFNYCRGCNHRWPWSATQSEEDSNE